MVVEGSRAALSLRYGMGSIRALNPTWVQPTWVADPIAAATEMLGEEAVGAALERGRSMELDAVTAFLAERIGAIRTQMAAGPQAPPR